jgi:hypothetical protein
MNEATSAVIHGSCLLRVPTDRSPDSYQRIESDEANKRIRLSAGRARALANLNVASPLGNASLRPY